MKTRSLALALAAGLFAGGLAAKPDHPVHLRLDVDRPVVLADTRERVILKIALDGLRLPSPADRPPVNLCLVIDRSGSMGGEKIARAREAALEALGRLGPDDIFSMVAFSNGVETLIPATRVGRRHGLEEAIRSLHAGGSTHLYGGVAQGAAEIRKHVEGSYTHRVILVSDGIANVGPSSPDDLARLGSALVKEGISVTTVGLGLDYNEDLMTRLARRSDGNTYFVEASRDLPRIFNEELGDVLAVVARRVVIELEFPNGVRPVGFIGREGTLEGRRGTISLNQLYRGQEKFALIEVEVDPAAEGVEREFAHARVRYEHAITGREVVAEARASVRMSRDQAKVIKAANHDVQTDYAANVIAMTKDAAVELVDANRPAAAVQELRTRAAELDEMARTYGNREVSSLSGREKAEADRLEREGLDPAARKVYRTESSQTYGQQRAQ